ncbi:hypothetical protein D3C74_409270 [compost metagenome]
MTSQHLVSATYAYELDMLTLGLAGDCLLQTRLTQKSQISYRILRTRQKNGIRTAQFLWRCHVTHIHIRLTGKGIEVCKVGNSRISDHRQIQLGFAGFPMTHGVQHH